MVATLKVLRILFLTLKVLRILFFTLTINKDVIQINQNKKYNERTQYLIMILIRVSKAMVGPNGKIHDYHKSSRRYSGTKLPDKPLKETTLAFEGCLPLTTSFNLS